VQALQFDPLSTFVFTYISTSQEKLKIKGCNKVSRKNRVNRIRCQEKKVSRKKEMPKDRDIKRKRRQRKAAEKKSVSRNSDEIRKNIVRREECVRSWASQLSTRRAVTIQRCQGQTG
jgi:hypothetical protein